MANTLLLLSDEHNPFVSEPYGHARVRTPNMSRLAAQGTLFQNAYCASPLCCPSRCALMTGRWPHELQAYSNCNLGLSDETETYAEALGRQGVYTAHFGKTDVHRTADKLGFDDIEYPHDRKQPGDTNHGRRPLSIRANAQQRASAFGPKENAFATDNNTVDAAIRWLEEKATTLSQPWVVVVNTHKPHFPHWVTPDLWEEYADAEDMPAHGKEHPQAKHPYAADLQKHFQTEKFTEEQIRGLRRGYYGCVTYVDQQLGRLVGALEANGLSESTNVIYASDHGDMIGKFGLWWKCSLYEDSVRVPLIAAGPDFQSGQTVRTPVSLLDLQASFFKNAGVAMPAERHGVALTEVPLEDPERAVFAEYHGHGTRSGAYLIRRGPWKAIFNMEADDQLFNLEDDPDELDDRASAEPAVLDSLRQELIRICDPEKENTRAHAFQDAQLSQIKQG